MATGVKTNNDMVGMAPDEEIEDHPQAAKSGKSTGLVSSSVTTPPASLRPRCPTAMMKWPSPQMLKPDVLLGGGKQFFLPESEGKQPERNLIEKPRPGLWVLENRDQLLKAKGKASGSLPMSMAPKLDRDKSKNPGRNGRTAINAEDEQGLFLMVEGSQIDWGGRQ